QQEHAKREAGADRRVAPPETIAGRRRFSGLDQANAAWLPDPRKVAVGQAWLDRDEADAAWLADPRQVAFRRRGLPADVFARAVGARLRHRNSDRRQGEPCDDE